MGFLETLNDEPATFFKTYIPCGGSLGDTVKVYALINVSPFNKVKVYAPIGGLQIDYV